MVEKAGYGLGKRGGRLRRWVGEVRERAGGKVSGLALAAARAAYDGMMVGRW
jgi:hypothetical protein